LGQDRKTPAGDVLDRTIDSAGPEAVAAADAVAREAAPQVADRMDGRMDGRADDHTEAHAQEEATPDASARVRGLARLRDWLARAAQFLVAQSSSSLTRRIVVLNVTGLVVLSIGILFLSQFRNGLIDARIQSLQVQGEIIAGAIASSATVETDQSITLDPDKLLNLHPGESYGPNEDALYGIDFPINP
jgi:two-component system sensor histidine kinase ChvG